MNRRMLPVLLTATFAWLIVRGAPREPSDQISLQEQAAGWSEVGDVIDVFPDDRTNFGTKVMLPPANGGKYWRIKVRGLSVEDARKLTEHITDMEGNVAKYRRMKLVLPDSVESTLYYSGEHVTDWGPAFQDLIKDKLL